MTNVNNTSKVIRGIQILTGLMLITFGLNGFLQFMPMPPMSDVMNAYMGALFQTGYIFPIVGVVELIAGLAFLSNRFVALMAVILMPIMINAFLAHLVLDIGGVGGSAIITILTIIIMIEKKEFYTVLFRSR